MGQPAHPLPDQEGILYVPPCRTERNSLLT